MYLSVQSKAKWPRSHPPIVDKGQIYGPKSLRLPPNFLFSNLFYTTISYYWIYQKNSLLQTKGVIVKKKKHRASDL